MDEVAFSRSSPIDIGGMVAAIMVLAIPASAQLQIDHIDTSRLPVIDGDLGDWEALFGPPHLTQSQFSSTWGEIRGAVPESDQKVEVWLGWHDRTDMIYVAARVTDLTASPSTRMGLRTPPFRSCTISTTTGSE